MLRTLVIALAFALGLQISTVKANECMSVNSIVTEFAKEGIFFRGTTAAATERMAQIFNSNREISGRPKVQVSIFLFGPVKRPDGSIAIVAVAVGKDSCVISGTVGLLTLRQFTDLAAKAQIGPKDLIPIDGA